MNQVIVRLIVNVEKRLVALHERGGLRLRHRRIPHGKVRDLAEEVAPWIPDHWPRRAYPRPGLCAAAQPNRPDGIGRPAACRLPLAIAVDAVDADALDVRIGRAKHAVDVHVVALTAIGARGHEVLVPEAVGGVTHVAIGVGRAAAHLSAAARDLPAVGVAAGVA